MDESDFEGTVVLEMLAAVGTVDEFFDAIDSDHFERAERLMRRAGVASETIQMVMKMMLETDGR